MPNIKENNPPGDLIVRFHIFYPQEVSDEQKDALRSILSKSDMTL